MKKALKKALKEPKEKKEVYKGSKVTPRHPRPGAQAVFQVPVATTPKPWIALAKKRRLEARDEDTTGQWDALAGSRHGRSNLKTCKKRTVLREVEAAYNLGITLPRATPSPSPAPAERADEVVGDGYLSADDIRGELLSRFDSSRVEMLNKETLILIGPDGKNEYFVKKKQTGTKSGTLI